MSVRPAIHVRMRSTLYVLAFVLTLVLLVILLVFGAIFALAHRNRRLGFSYLPSGMTTSKAEDEDNPDF
jgi:hypothetical protein